MLFRLVTVKVYGLIKIKLHFTQILILIQIMTIQVKLISKGKITIYIYRDLIHENLLLKQLKFMQSFLTNLDKFEQFNNSYNKILNLS